MSPVMFGTLALALLCPGIFAQQTFDDDSSFPDPIAAVTEGLVAASAELSEEGYSSVANLRSDSAMKIFAQRVLARFGRKVLDEGALSGFVPHYSGTMGTQSFGAFVDELTKVSWTGRLEDHVEPLNSSFDQDGKQGYNHSGWKGKGSWKGKGGWKGWKGNSTASSASDSVNVTAKLQPHTDTNRTTPQMPRALMAVRVADEAQQLAQERLKQVAEKVQHTQQVTRESQHKLEKAQLAVSSLKEKQREVAKAIQEATKAQNAAFKPAGKGGKPGQAPANKEAAMKAAAALKARKVEELRSVTDRLHAEEKLAKSLEAAVLKRQHDLKSLWEKRDSLKKVAASRKKLSTSATSNLQKQVLEVDMLSDAEERLRDFQQKQASALASVRKQRVDAMRKFNMTSAKTRQIVQETVQGKSANRLSRSAAPQRAVPKAAVPQRVVPKAAAPQRAAPKAVAPQRAVPKASQQRAVHKAVAPQHAKPKAAAPQHAKPKAVAPQRAKPLAPQHAKSVAPQHAVPKAPVKLRGKSALL